MIENRARILDAAARVYAEFGFRGATTRRIAVAAGVNEVTLFRTFGSKAALIDEAVRACAQLRAPHGMLPAEPVDPERELTEWATAILAHLRERSSIFRKTMSEVEERPDAVPCVADGMTEHAEELRAYMQRLCLAGFVDWNRLAGKTPATRNKPAARVEIAFAAGTMLVAALLSDAMGREMMPGFYPEPADRAPALYVRLFLRAVECNAPARRRTRITPKLTRT